MTDTGSPRNAPASAQPPNRLIPPRHPAAFLTFLAVAFGWTWGLWGLITLLQPHTPALATTLFLLSGIGPSLAAVIVIAAFDGRAALRQWLHRCLRWRFAFGWYAIAFCGPPLVMLAALALHAVLGGVTPPSPAAGHIGPTLAQFALVLVIGGPLGEEFGWRGYALAVLTPRLGWRSASLVLGAIWALWHVPLFFMPGMAQAQMPMALFMASSVALSVIFARLAVNTAFSVLPAIVLHWSVNAWSWVIPVTPQGAGIQPYVLVMGLLVLVAITLFLKPGPRPSQRSLQQ